MINKELQEELAKLPDDAEVLIHIGYSAGEIGCVKNITDRYGRNDIYISNSKGE